MIENWNILNGKPIYLLVTGLFLEKHFESKVAYKQIPEEIREKISGYTKVPGQLDNESLKKSAKFVLHLFGADIESKISKRAFKQSDCIYQVRTLSKVTTISFLSYFVYNAYCRLKQFNFLSKNLLLIHLHINFYLYLNG